MVDKRAIEKCFEEHSGWNLAGLQNNIVPLLADLKFWEEWWRANRTVVRVQFAIYHSNGEEWYDDQDVLLWPDGEYTDLDGSVINWSGNLMRNPPFFKRSMDGVEVILHTDENPNVIFVNNSRGTKWPLIIAPIEELGGLVFQRYLREHEQEVIEMLPPKIFGQDGEAINEPIYKK